jgi:hypothetical protein
MSGPLRERQAAATPAGREMIRCPGCSRAQRHECIGRRDAAGMPLCSCIQCHGKAIRADAELYSDPVTVELRRYVWQVRNRERLRTTWPQKPRTWRCEAPGCGNTAVSRRFGPRRRYCSSACRKRAWRHRRSEREAAERSSRAAERAASGRPEPGAGNRATGRRSVPEARPAVPLPGWMESALGEGKLAEVPEVSAADRRRWRTPAGQK